MIASGLVCEVCNLRPAIGVAALPGIPMSCAFCEPCLEVGAIPIWAAVANTAMIGGMEEAAPWWVDTVHATLTHLDVSPAEFDRLVAQAAADMDQMPDEPGEIPDWPPADPPTPPRSTT